MASSVVENVGKLELGVCDLYFRPDCAEMLRALGFRRLISVENFRSPNFPLVAEILTWLVHRFDPKADLPTDTDTEQDRVIFVRSVAQFMAGKAHVRLNTKRLYQSDGYAVQEILKGLGILYAAIQNNSEGQSAFEEHSETTLNFDVSNKISELKQIRSLASEITSRGATLYDLLRREVDLRETRTTIINRQLELAEVEVGMQEAIRACDDEVKRNQAAIENVDSDQASLESKIEKKKTGLERGQKRLLTLKKVRPAFMDEYEKLEQDLKRQYEFFVQKFISLSYLENQLDDYDRHEQEKMAERETATMRMLERMRTEENRLGSAAEDSDDSEDDEDDDDDDDEDEDEELLKDMKDKITEKQDTGKKSIGKGSRRMFGNMTGVDLDSESLDSDTDLNLDGVGDSDLDTAELELGGGQEAGAMEAARGGMGVAMANGGTKLKGSRIRAAAAPPPDDDDDF
ncbi:clusterin-associated protein 1-like isoform X2 [Eriocheir sinensis]|uniref:clusterin-associated protein 1-like isoform X2 n=1 Tax=Eriocheir sinensis TaxID=95602 RepID=UPI0021C98CD9|nr:clusterin-associated protein 1-like isoform X2 [Eriocheir sinensis]